MSLQTLFGITHPIIQAPMAGAQSSAMADAILPKRERDMEHSRETAPGFSPEDGHQRVYEWVGNREKSAFSGGFWPRNCGRIDPRG